MVDLNSLCTFVLGAGRVILGGGGFKTKGNQGPSLLYMILLLVYWPVFLDKLPLGVGGGERTLEKC